MSVKKIPRFQRPREKLLEKGSQGLTDLELMMLLLQSGNQAQDIRELAKKVLPKGKIHVLQKYTFNQLCSMSGIGESKAALLIAVREVAQRLYNTHHVPYITTADDILKIVSFIRSKRREYFVGVYMNARQQLIKSHIISIGSIDASIAHPREVFEPAIRLRASGIIVAHNHPSGDPEPSQADIILTKRLQRAGNILGIQLIDHIIVADKGYISLKEAGFMDT